MTTPSTPQKRFLAAGAIKSAHDWGTAEEIVAALAGMLIDSDGGLSRKQPYHPANEADTPFTKEGDLGLIEPVDFAPEFFMRYNPGVIGVLIAQLFGLCGAPANPAGSAYTQKMTWEDENDGEFCTFAIEKSRMIFEVPSAKPYSLDLSIVDGFLRGAIGLRGDSFVEATQNVYGIMDALTYVDRASRIKFSQVTVDMNDQGEGDASSETALIVSDFSVHYERPMDGLHAAGGAGIIQPAQNGQPIITVTMTFPRMDEVNDEYFADFIAETKKKVRFEFIGANMTGGMPYFLRLFFPRMRITNIEYPFDDIVPSTITLQAEEAISAPIGMDYTKPYLVWQNVRSSKYIS